MKKASCVIAAVLALAGYAGAIQVLYTGEGDSVGATDKLTEDGSHDGTFTQTWSNNVKSASSNVYVTNAMAKLGAASFRFNTTAYYLHTIDIANATTLGSAFTLAAYVRPDFAPVRKRIFSTYAGEAAGLNQLIFDYGSEINGIRLLVNGSSIYPTVGEAVAIPAAAYSHLAATYDNGAVKLYLNGKLVKSGTSGSGTPIIDNNAGWRIQVGEDWIRGIAYMDQTVGFMDDVLIYDRAMTADEIGGLAYYGAEVFLSGHLIHPGILYTAEGDDTNATDRLISDNSQDGTFTSTNVTVSTDNPRFGASAYRFAHPAGTTEFKTIELPGTKSLGKYFTLAAYVDTTATTTKQRLFTSYSGGGLVTSSVLIFEFDPDGNAENFTIRLNHNGILTTATTNFADGAYHHLALTYEDGAAKLYLDGIEVGSGTYPAGAVSMTYDLRVGEDWGGTIVNEQLVGDVDDIVMLRKVLTASEIMLLKEQGGQKFLAPPPPPPKGTSIYLR